MTPHPASFRDVEACVFLTPDGRVLRALSTSAAERDRKWRECALFDRLAAEGSLIESWRCDDAPPDGFAAVVEARRVPFVNYPYEWSFTMLKDAALLTLRLNEAALEQHGILRDASAYNVVFSGARPVFVDLSSFGNHREGEPWLAYGQFCDQFLAPLLLEAYKGVPFQPVLRGSLEGVSITEQLAPLFGLASFWRPGVLWHVKVRARVERSARRMGTSARRKVRMLPVPLAAVRRNLRGMARLVARLKSPLASHWLGYDSDNTYAPEQAERKAAFVAEAADRAAPHDLAWDVGANTGRYSRVLARRFEHVVALESDAVAADALYRGLQGQPEAARITPLVMDIMNPSPGQGLEGRERDSLLARGRPRLACWLAVLHHLCLGRNLPLARFFDLCARTSPLAVVEWVSPEDPMSQALRATRSEPTHEYSESQFESLARARGEVVERTSLSATRALYLLALRSA